MYVQNQYKIHAHIHAHFLLVILLFCIRLCLYHFAKQAFSSFPNMESLVQSSLGQHGNKDEVLYQVDGLNGDSGLFLPFKYLALELNVDDAIYHPYTPFHIVYIDVKLAFHSFYLFCVLV